MYEDDRDQGSAPADLVGGLSADALPEGWAVDDLTRFEQVASTLHQAQAELVGLAEQTAKAMGGHQGEGRGGDDFLNPVGRVPGKDRSATATTGAMLSRMPHTQQ